jgi:hypothetical protein
MTKNGVENKVSLFCCRQTQKKRNPKLLCKRVAPKWRNLRIIAIVLIFESASIF